MNGKLEGSIFRILEFNTMSKIIQNIKENYKLVLAVLVIGLFLGWLFFHSSGDATTPAEKATVAESHDHEAEATIWTCSMHPQIRMDHPGKCPICAMDLVPLNSLQSDEEQMNPNEIAMTESAAKLAEIQTMTVSKGAPEKTVYLQGKVHADERNIAELTARFGGRIEKLFVNFTGQQVKKGEKLATIYSPNLVTAQRELLESIALKDSRPSLYNAAKSKLKLWDLTDGQIASIEEKGEPLLYFDILSPITGTVMMRHVSLGDYVKEGNALFQIINLTRVWVMFDAYESDLPWVKTGDQVNFTIQAIPGKNFKGKVSYIDPFINSATRVAKVRVEIANPKLDLKPEMFVNGTVQSKIAENSNDLLIPKSAVLWTGKRSVVYVKVPERENPTFLYRQIELGPEAGNFYVITDGLSEGEEIAVNGVFKIDAAAQLQGLPSMMNPAPGESEGFTPSTTKASHRTSEGFTASETLTKSEHVMFNVSGNCDMCKDRIETAAKAVDGVLSASWEADKQLLHLQFDPGKTSADAVQKAIAAVGHDTEKYKAPDAAYNELPECCLYRSED